MTVAERERTRVGQADGRERALHHHLVHGHRRAHDARSHVGEVRQLEQALHGAVLAVGPVQQRNTTSTSSAPTAGATSPSIAKALGSAFGPASMAARRGVGQQPLALDGDGHGHDLVARRVERRATATAVARDTSCSAERPPNSRSTRRRRAITTPGAPLGCRAPSGTDRRARRTSRCALASAGGTGTRARR